MEPEANEFPKGPVLGRDGNLHIRLTRSTPLGNVRCYNPSPLGARRPRQHTRTTRQSGSDTILSHPRLGPHHIPGSTPP
ncbi:hypothetical protein C1H46_016784 [Malus baccata]|uniref:Uncharacterized protein n=1 Tax=Malus baccata TaxID=106549 RepID=A0A540MFU3_MALBA|nr:hypothetical protein C1H46_016784 [Malus baccata]